MNTIMTSAKKLTVKAAAAIMAALMAVTAFLPTTAKAASWKEKAYETDLISTVTGTTPVGLYTNQTYFIDVPCEMAVTVTFTMDGDCDNDFYVFLKDGDNNFIHGVCENDFKYSKKTNSSVETFTYTVKAGEYYVGVENIGCGAGAAYTMDINARVNKKTTITSAKRENGKAIIKWTAVSGVSGYEIYRMTNGGDWEDIGYVDSQYTSIYDPGATCASATYKYAIIPFFNIDGQKLFGLCSNQKTLTK